MQAGLGRGHDVLPAVRFHRRAKCGPAADAHLIDREHSIRAANGSVEAISRCGALTDYIRGQGARIASLEALCDDLAEALAEVLGTL